VSVNVEDFLAGYQPRTVTVLICQRAALLDEHARIEAEVLRDGGGSLAGRTKAGELAALEDQIEEASTAFRFRALGRRGWADLLRQHPPSKDDAKLGIDFNPETFPQAAIAASSVEPEISPEQSERLAEVLPQGEWEKLWAAVLTCNIEGVEPPKSVLAAVARTMSVASSTTAAPTGSLAASS
jgi:hypothetical protein